MLVDNLKTLIADLYVLYFKAHSFHWNVEGPNFPQYHSFLEDYYTDVYGSIDTVAELIRTLDAYAPTSLTKLIQLSTIKDEETIPFGVQMFTVLKQDNDLITAKLMTVYTEADTQGELGIANYIQDRIQAHEKHGWMLRAMTK